MLQPGSASTAPVLVLGIGNSLLGDDGVGVELLSHLKPMSAKWGPDVDLLDGGTCGLRLLGEVEDRRAVVVLDAVRLGAPPGSVHVLREAELFGMNGGATSAHESGVKEILQAMELLGTTPKKLAVVGIEPAKVDTGIGLSEEVRRGLEHAITESIRLIEECLEARDVSRYTRKDY